MEHVSVMDYYTQKRGDYFLIEACVVACVMLNQLHVNEMAAEITAQDFYTATAKQTYNLLYGAWETSGFLDEGLIANFPAASKAMVIDSVNECDVIPSQWKVYLSELRKFTKKQRVNNILATLQMNQDASLEDVTETIESAYSILHDTEKSPAVLTFKDAVTDFMGSQQKPVRHYKTGFGIMDRHIAIEPGDFIVVGGRPSSGKTIYTLNMAMSMARNGIPVVYFSLETSARKLFARLVSAEAGIHHSKVRYHSLSPEDWVEVNRVTDEMKDIPFTLVEASGKPVSWVRAESKRLGAKVAFVDYMGLLWADGKTRYEMMTNISIGLHTFAQSTGTTVIAVSQLNRASGDNKPTMADLRESGQIEQDADAVILLYAKRDEKGLIEKSVASIVKNKEGKIGDVPMILDGEHMRLREIDESRSFQ